MMTHTDTCTHAAQHRTLDCTAKHCRTLATHTHTQAQAREQMRTLLLVMVICRCARHSAYLPRRIHGHFERIVSSKIAHCKEDAKRRTSYTFIHKN